MKKEKLVEDRKREDVIIENIFRLLKERKITQKRYAIDNNMSESILSGWKKQKNINLSQIIEACDYFQVPLEEIYYTEKELRELNFKRANPNHVHIFAQKIEKIIPYDEQIKRGFINIISALIIFILLCMIVLTDKESRNFKLGILAIGIISLIIIRITLFYKKDYILNYTDEIVFKIENTKNQFYIKHQIMRVIQIILSIVSIIYSKRHLIGNSNFEHYYLLILNIFFIIFTFIVLLCDKRIFKEKIYYYEFNGLNRIINASFISLGYVYVIVRFLFEFTNIWIVLLSILILLLSLIILYDCIKKYCEYNKFYVDEEKKYVLLK